MDVMKAVLKKQLDEIMPIRMLNNCKVERGFGEGCPVPELFGIRNHKEPGLPPRMSPVTTHFHTGCTGFRRFCVARFKIMGQGFCLAGTAARFVQ